MDLEAQLHEEMIGIYRSVGLATGYWANRYLPKVKKVGGLQAAKEWLKPKSNPTSGLQKLVDINRLDLSVEALVLRQPWCTLFTAEELQVAQTRLNVASGFCLAEEVLDDSNLVEGAVRQITINSYERNSDARRTCIEHYGTVCVVCDFDFGESYGAIAKGLIHVHHLKPLSEIQQQYEVDPIADLRPVCPNCHAVIHLGRQTRTIEEVRSWFQKRLHTRENPQP
jgi:HNH endonuclease